MFHKLYKAAIGNICCLCDTQGICGLDLCQFCHKALPHNHFSCHQCAAPISAADGNKDRLICGRCLATPSSIDHSIVPYLYRPPVDFMIKRLKFHEQLKYSRVLGDLLADAIERYYAGAGPNSGVNGCGTFPDLILPMPVHRERLLQRGFNQAQEIANSVANRFSKKCNTTAVSRSVSPRPQSSLSAARREANIRRTFDIPNPAVINGLHVAVVDDVYTTGATARAISKKLKSAGATKVSIWAVARTP